MVSVKKKQHTSHMGIFLTLKKSHEWLRKNISLQYQTLSTRKVMRKKKISIWGLLVDPRPNSPT